jgi:hypothetical protein
LLVGTVAAALEAAGVDGVAVEAVAGAVVDAVPPPGWTWPEAGALGAVAAGAVAALAALPLAGPAAAGTAVWLVRALPVAATEASPRMSLRR